MALNKAKIQELREATEGFNHVIHLNSAGASLPPNIVRDTVIDYLKEEALSGGYELHRQRAKELEATYDSIAKLINAFSSEIALVENATAAWNAAFYAIDWQPEDEVICNQGDYASNYLAYLHHPAKPIIKVIPNKENGDLDLEAFERMVTAKTKLVSITHMATNSGYLAPAEEIGLICYQKGVLYLLDACQTVGQYPIDVAEIHCDMLSATGRKYLRGPRGTGFLYVRRKNLPILRPAMIDLHSAEWTGEHSYEIRSDARMFENWEGNRANQVGLKVAADYANEIGLEAIWERVQKLSQYARKKLEDFEKVHCHDEGSVLGGIISFTVEGYSALQVQDYLHLNGVNISWNGKPNTYLDMKAKGLDEIARCSVHYYNNEEEIDRFIELLQQLSQ